jgi:hypothetical protein
MIDDSSAEASGDGSEPATIDIGELLACIPDETSDGLRRDDVLGAYQAGRPTPVREHDFDAALARLESEGRVRTTTKRRSGIQVQFYLRTSR